MTASELNQAGFSGFLHSNRHMKPTDLILRCAAKRSLEGRSSARHPSFEAPLRCAPQSLWIYCACFRTDCVRRVCM